MHGVRQSTTVNNKTAEQPAKKGFSIWWLYWRCAHWHLEFEHEIAKHKPEDGGMAKNYIAKILFKKRRASVRRPFLYLATAPKVSRNGDRLGFGGASRRSGATETAAAAAMDLERLDRGGVAPVVSAKVADAVSLLRGRKPSSSTSMGALESTARTWRMTAVWEFTCLRTKSVTRLIGNAAPLSRSVISCEDTPLPPSNGRRCQPSRPLQLEYRHRSKPVCGAANPRRP